LSFSSYPDVAVLCVGVGDEYTWEEGD